MSGVTTPLPPLTLVLGGARSGKSRYAEALVDRHPGRRTYLATAEILDEEMAARVSAHRDRRDSDWKTVEEPLELSAALKAETEQGAAVLVDCLTLWLGNLMGKRRDAEAEIAGLVEEVQSPHWATACGLALYSMRSQMRGEGPGGKSSARKVADWIGSIRDKFR